jgi:hypothetical protein
MEVATYIYGNCETLKRGMIRVAGLHYDLREHRLKLIK